MTRPVEFEEGYVAARNLPYEIVETVHSGAHLGGGVLGKGHCVWMQAENARILSHAVPVFDEDLGIIYLDPRLLCRRTGNA